MIEIIQYNDKYKESTKEFILKILIGEFGLGNIERPDLDNISNIYQKDKSNFWIAVDNYQVIGSIAVKNYGNNRAYLKRMYVDGKHRATGLAKKLLDTALAYAKEAGFREIFLGTVEDMVAANKFYSKSGFKKINKLPDDLPDFGDTIFYKLTL
ncbi:MAG: GNAT family N-acetyltransferase [Candidatus Micrarchaeia archaeon]|jgi:ribosomal protein S18 acetylase RimI-like enzyme